MSVDLRYEVKILTDSSHLGEVRSWVYTHSFAFRTAFPPRFVNNIYFDTQDRQCLVDHIAGVFSRSKVRFRWYGDTWKVQDGQLEIKKKIAQLNHKDTFPFSGQIDLSKSNWRELYVALLAGIEGESSGLGDFLKILQPTLINRYQREYFLSMDGVVRLTLDYDGTSYEQSFGLKPNLRYPQPSRSDLIIEIKAPKNEHYRIADALAEFPQRVSPNSKYLTGLEYAHW